MTLGLAGGFDSGFGEIPSVFLQKLDKAFRGLRQRMGLLADPADGDGIVKALDGTLDYPLRPVAFGDEAGAQIIALTLLHDHQALIESVDNGDLLGIKVRHQHLLLQNGGRVGVQLIHDAGIRVQLLDRQDLLGGQRMGLMDKHIGLAVKKRVKFQIVVAKDTVHVLSAAAADEQYAQLRGFVHNLLNDLRALSYQEFIGIGFLLIGILIGHHGVDDEAVMLAADAEGLVGLAQIL